MNNTRFATVIHILTLLANFPDEWLSSDLVAGSININPVIVRKELGVLQSAGLVVSRKGKDGGSKLKKASEDISLSEVYLSVKNSDVLGKKNLNPNPKCSVGKQINENLEQLFDQTDQLVIEALSHKTLNDFVKKFH